MVYNKQQWKDEIPDLTKPIKDSSGKQKTDPQTGRPLYELVQEGTRLTSQRLNHIEDGIETVHELADQNAADIDTHKKDTVKHITAAERAEWKAKETPAGAQTKADAALSAAKTYADTALLAKADKSSTYSKTETDQRIQAVVGAAPDALDTLKEIGDALNNDPNFAATVTNQLSGKVDKVSGKQLSTEDYSSAEKAKLAGLTPGAGAAGSATDATIGNRTADSSIATPYSLTGTITQWLSWLTKYLKAITGKANPFDTPDITLAATKTHVDNTTLHVTAAERTAWNAAESNAKNASIPKTEKGSASGVPAMDAAKLILGNGIRLGATPFYGQQAFLLTLAAVSNQKADIIISGPVHGRIKVTIAGAYAGTDAKGVLVKTYAVILSPPNVVNSAPSRYLEATDDLPNHISIGEIAYDATNARYFIPIEARSAYINTFSITVETWSSVRDATVSLSPVYTGTVTTLPKAVQVLENNVQLLNGKEFQKHQLTQNDGLAFVYSTGSLDTLTTPGDYYTGGAVTGKHADFGSGLVEVHRIVGGNAGVFQRATDFSSLRSFIRYLSAAGTWLSWYEFEHSGRRNVANGYAGLDPGGDVYDAQIPPNIARKGVVIADGTDLNSIAEGEYYCYGNVNAATMTNMPAAVAGQAFSLSVTKHAGYNQRLTTYIAGVTMRVFTRNIYNGVFSEWYELEHSGKKNAANGYAGLDSSAKVPRANTYSSLGGGATTITNMDTLYTAGVFPIGNSATGAPETGYGQAVVHVSTGEVHDNLGNWVWQMWFGVTGGTWVRQKVNNGIWQPWAKLWTEKNDQLLIRQRSNVAAGTDLNTVTTSGVYHLSSASSYTNSPGIDWCALNVYVTSTAYVVQEVYSVNLMNRSFRTRTELGVWSPWTPVITGAGGTMTAALVRNYDGTFYSYRNLVGYNATGTATGTIKITLPKTWSNTMMSIKIKGYDYTPGKGAWELILGGYNYSTTPAWANVSAVLNGRVPFDRVRLAHDGTNNCILLGSLTTVWGITHIEVSEFTGAFGAITGWEKGWQMGLITSETGIFNAVTPALTPQYGKASATNYFVTTTSEFAFLARTPAESGNFEARVYLRLTAASSVKVTATYKDHASTVQSTVIVDDVFPIGSYSLPVAFFAATSDSPISILIKCSAANAVYASGSIIDC